MLLAGGLLTTAALDGQSVNGHGQFGPSAALVEPALEVRLTRGRLALTGTSTSLAHEQAIEAFLGKHFEGHDVDITLSPGVAVPPDWAEISLQALETLAVLESAVVVANLSKIAITGLTSSPDSYRTHLAGLRSRMPVATDVTAVPGEHALQHLCAQVFRRLESMPIAFRQAGSSLRSSAFGPLDRLIEFAYDCPQTRIRILGHSDALGDEVSNRQLSYRRAQAAADYLIAAGIGPERLDVIGLGSSRPVANNNSAYGRSRNRRVEFALQW